MPDIQSSGDSRHLYIYRTSLAQTVKVHSPPCFFFFFFPSVSRERDCPSERCHSLWAPVINKHVSNQEGSLVTIWWEIQLSFCQFILLSLLNCHQVLMTLGSCQPGLIQARNTVPKAFSIPFIGHPQRFLPFPLRKLDLICLSFSFLFLFCFVLNQHFRYITGSR